MHGNLISTATWITVGSMIASIFLFSDPRYRSTIVPVVSSLSVNDRWQRRDLLRSAPAVVLAPALVFPNSALANPSDVQPQPGRTYVITGATSGIGLEACKALAKNGQNTIVLVGRTAQRAQAAVDMVQQATAAGTTTTTSTKIATLIPAECDLASLKSIERFATFLSFSKQQNIISNIDTLCLNAGLSRNTKANDCLRTMDGYELTFGVNHVGHFYLNHLVIPMLKLSPLGGRIVVTASGVHDPDSPGGAQGIPATLGHLDGLERLGRDCEMVDGGPFNADKAYKDSKLCNVLFTRELQRRLSLDETTKHITVNCFNPGLIVSTGLFRDQNPIFTKLFDFAATDLFKVGETPEWGGQALQYMTTVSTKGHYYTSPPGSSKYGKEAFGQQFTTSQVSKEAQDTAKGQRLWELTAQSLGMAV